MPGRICDHCIQLPAAQGRLVYAHDRTKIFLIEDPVLRMVKLIPLPVITENLLILARQIAAVDSVM